MAPLILSRISWTGWRVWRNRVTSAVRRGKWKCKISSDITSVCCATSIYCLAIRWPKKYSDDRTSACAYVCARQPEVPSGIREGPRDCGRRGGRLGVSNAVHKTSERIRSGVNERHVCQFFPRSVARVG
jgi:hypothetical protein